MSKTIYYAADKRGHADHGWLNAHHSFSFAGFYDPAKTNFGVLRVLNDDVIAGGMGFGRHPHDNMEIITLALEGTLAHKDSMGHEQTIVPNEVQVMSAGTGVQHSEYNYDADKSANILQTWIFPNKRNVQPRYGQQTFAPEDRINKLQTIVSPIDKDDEGLKIHQDAWIYRTTLEAGHNITLQPHNAKNGFYIFLIEGKIKAGEQMLNKRDAAGITEADNVELAAEVTSDVLIYEVPM